MTDAKNEGEGIDALSPEFAVFMTKHSYQRGYEDGLTLADTVEGIHGCWREPYEEGYADGRNERRKRKKLEADGVSDDPEA